MVRNVYGLVTQVIKLYQYIYMCVLSSVGCGLVAMGLLLATGTGTGAGAVPRRVPVCIFFEGWISLPSPRQSSNVLRGVEAPPDAMSRDGSPMRVSIVEFYSPVEVAAAQDSHVSMKESHEGHSCAAQPRETREGEPGIRVEDGEAAQVEAAVIGPDEALNTAAIPDEALAETTVVSDQVWRQPRAEIEEVPPACEEVVAAPTNSSAPIGDEDDTADGRASDGLPMWKAAFTPETGSHDDLARVKALRATHELRRHLSFDLEEPATALEPHSGTHTVSAGVRSPWTVCSRLSVFAVAIVHMLLLLWAKNQVRAKSTAAPDAAPLHSDLSAHAHKVAASSMPTSFQLMMVLSSGGGHRGEPSCCPRTRTLFCSETSGCWLYLHSCGAPAMMCSCMDIWSSCVSCDCAEL